MSIICLSGLSLIGIDVIWLLLLVYVCVNENHDKRPMLYWLPKLHKRPVKSRFIVSSGSCTTTELCICLTSCLPTIKKTCNRIL